jgi:hypothetical protein
MRGLKARNKFSPLSLGFVGIGIALAAPAFVSAAVISLPTSAGYLNYDTSTFATFNSIAGASSTFTLAGGTDGSTFSSNNVAVASGGTLGLTIGQNSPLLTGTLTLNLPVAVSSPQNLTVWEAGFPADNFTLDVSKDNGSTWSSSLLYNGTLSNPLGTVFGGPDGTVINTAFISLSDFSSYLGASPADEIQISGSDHPDIIAVSASVPEPASLSLIGISALGLLARRRRA